MTQTEIAQKANTGYQIWLLLENARQNSYSAFTLAKVEKALGWRVGDIERILGDEDFMPPIDEEEDDTTREVQKLIRRVEELESTVNSIERFLDRLLEARPERRGN